MDPNDPGNIISNMGLMLIIGAVIVVIVTVLFVGSYVATIDYKLYTKFRRLQEKIYYNAIIRYLLQSCLKLGVASATTLTLMNWSEFKFKDFVSVLSASLVLIVIVLSPIAFRLILMHSYKNLPRPSMK